MERLDNTRVGIVRGWAIQCCGHDLIGVNSTGNSITQEKSSEDKTILPDHYNSLGPTVTTPTYLKKHDNGRISPNKDNDISISSCKSKHCLIPTLTFLQHFSKSNYQKKNGSGLHRYRVNYKQAEGRLFCVDCANDPVGMNRRLANVVFHSDEYHNFMRQKTSWFERDFIDSYGILTQHEIHCSITWFFPNPELKPIRQIHQCTLPCFVKRVVTVIHQKNHYAVLEINMCPYKRVMIYDGHQYKYGRNVDRWMGRSLIALQSIGWLEHTMMEVPIEWIVHPVICYKQDDGGYICGGVACMVVEYLLRFGEVPITFMEVSPQEIRNHILEKWDGLQQKYIIHIWSNCNTKAGQELLLEQRKNNPSFDIPTKMQPHVNDGHNVVVLCDSSPENKNKNLASLSITPRLRPSGATSIEKTKSPPIFLETSSIREEQDFDSEVVKEAFSTHKQADLPAEKNNTTKVKLKNETCPQKEMKNKSVQKDKSEIRKSDNKVATKSKRRRVLLPMSSRSSPNVRSKNA
jgi:hypothetical protein